MNTRLTARGRAVRQAVTDLLILVPVAAALIVFAVVVAAYISRGV